MVYVCILLGHSLKKASCKLQTCTHSGTQSAVLTCQEVHDSIRSGQFFFRVAGKFPAKNELPKETGTVTIRASVVIHRVGFKYLAGIHTY